MNNKVIVELVVPQLETNYNIYLPVSKKIGDIINLLIKAVNDFSEVKLEYNQKIALYNSLDGTRYNSDDILYNTNIRNGSRLVLI